MSELLELKERVEELEKESEIIFSVISDLFPTERQVYEYTIDYKRPKEVSTWSI